MGYSAIDIYPLLKIEAAIAVLMVIVIALLIAVIATLVVIAQRLKKQKETLNKLYNEQEQATTALYKIVARNEINDRKD